MRVAVPWAELPRQAYQPAAAGVVGWVMKLGPLVGGMGPFAVDGSCQLEGMSRMSITFQAGNQMLGKRPREQRGREL